MYVIMVIADGNTFEKPEDAFSAPEPITSNKMAKAKYKYFTVLYTERFLCKFTVNFYLLF